MANNFKQNFINAVLGKLGSNTQYSPEIEEWLQTLPQEQRLGAANGKNFGNKDILAKQQELNIPIPQGQEQLALANEGKFNPYTHGATRQGGLINGYNQGYNLQYDNPSGQISTRIGQALGTLKRGADSPLGRAVIAYGTSRVLGDSNPLKQAGIAYSTRQNANTANQLYRQQLDKMGIDTSKIGGDINDAMYKNMITGYNAGAKTMTLQDLANLGDQRAINAINNGANPFTTVNNSIGRDMLNNVLGKNEAMIDYYGAKTDNINQLTPWQIQKIKNDINIANQRVAIARQKLANGTGSVADYNKAVKAAKDMVALLNGVQELPDELKQYVQIPTKNGGNVPIPQTTQTAPKTAIISKGGKQYRIDASRRKEYEAQGGTFVRYE